MALLNDIQQGKECPLKPVVIQIVNVFLSGNVVLHINRLHVRLCSVNAYKITDFEPGLYALAKCLKISVPNE
jgi:hypothetical protein